MEIQTCSMTPSKTGNSTRENQISKREGKNEEITCITLDSDEEDEEADTSLKSVGIKTSVIKTEPIDEFPTSSSSTSSEIGCPSKVSTQTGNIQNEVGCSTDKTSRATEKPILTANQGRASESKIRKKCKFKGMRSHKCPYCEKKYSSNMAKNYHVKNFHTHRQTYSCATCGKALETKQIWKNHQAVHSLDRPFPCSICPDRFKTNSRLQNHHLNAHHERAQLQQNPKPVADNNTPSLSIEGRSAEASGQITSKQIPSLAKVDSGSLGTHPVGNNDSMALSFVLNDNPIQISISDNPISPKVEVGDDETDELEKETNSATTSEPSFSGNNSMERVGNGKMKVQKGMRKSTRKRKPRKPFSATFTGGQRGYYKCPHCKKRFASSGKRDCHVKQAHGQTRSIPECRPDEDTNGPSSSNKLLFQAGLAFGFPETLPSTDDEENKCDKCEKTFGTMHSLKRHKQDFHSEVYRFECSLCDLKFPRKDYYENHLRTKLHQELEAKKEIITTHPRDQTEPQPQNGSSISAEGLTEEIAMSSSAAGNNSVTFKSTAKRVGDIDYPLACGECNAGFVNDVELVFHVQNSHPDKGFDCQLCSNRGLSLLDYYTCLHSHFAS